MFDYQCCICKGTLSSQGGASPLDPCTLTLVSNFDLPREGQKEQQFFCHFECFRKTVNDDGIMHIMEPDFSTIGEIEEEVDGA